MNRPSVQSFVHEPTSTFSYVVWDPSCQQAAVIDAVLDYDETAGRTLTDSADRIVDFVRQKALVVDWVLETHAHADHLAAGSYIRRQLGGRTGIGKGIKKVQSHFKAVYNLERGFLADGSQFEHLFDDGERFRVGNIEAYTLPTPGHTSDGLTYVIGDAAFVGDSLFMPDGGTARCDFPGGSAQTLYRSIARLFELPDATRVFVLHDYRPGGRAYLNETTIGEQRRSNIHAREGVTEAQFVKLRDDRDRTLGMPKLIIPAVQINIRAGELPPAEDNGTRYIKVPLNEMQNFSRITRS